eukprot:scaffold82106_cov22-Tisochrysis_lutea.AAC.1
MSHRTLRRDRIGVPKGLALRKWAVEQGKQAGELEAGEPTASGKEAEQDKAGAEESLGVGTNLAKKEGRGWRAIMVRMGLDIQEGEALPRGGLARKQACQLSKHHEADHLRLVSCPSSRLSIPSYPLQRFECHKLTQ